MRWWPGFIQWPRSPLSPYNPDAFPVPWFPGVPEVDGDQGSGSALDTP